LCRQSWHRANTLASRGPPHRSRALQTLPLERQAPPYSPPHSLLLRGIHSAPQNPPPARLLPAINATPCPRDSGQASGLRGHQSVSLAVAGATVSSGSRNERDEWSSGWVDSRYWLRFSSAMLASSGSITGISSRIG